MHQWPGYTIEDGARVSTGQGMRIQWQRGPFTTEGTNGAMVELPVRALIQHVSQLNMERPCDQNREILIHLNAVLGLIDERTRDRNNRGVLGTLAR